MTDADPTVRVAIVNWNTADAALASARAYRDSTGVAVDVVIVDNLSEPAQRARLQDGVPEGVELLMAERNLGYGAAANRGLGAADSGFVCVSNADLKPDAGMLAALVAVASSAADVGLVGPRFDDAQGGYHNQLPQARHMPVWASTIRLGQVAVPDPAPGAVVAAEQPAGACLLMRAEVWRALGGFDERFFLWMEDLDLARRALALGYRNLIVGAAVAGHVGAASFVQVPVEQKYRIWSRSVLHYTAVHHPAMLTATRLVTRICTVAFVLLGTVRRWRERIRSHAPAHHG